MQTHLQHHGTLAARVLSRQEIMDFAAQGEQFVWFVRSGGQYYALGSAGEAVPVNISGTLGEGAILTYDGDTPDNISWEIDTLNSGGSNVNGTITIRTKSVTTGDYIFPDSGNLFAPASENWKNLNITIVSDIVQGNDINVDCANIMHGWNQFVTYSENGFQASTLNYTNAPRTEQEVIYCALIDDEIEVNPEEPVEPEEPEGQPTITARVISRQEMINLAEQGEQFVWFVRSGGQYYALGSAADAVPVYVSGTLQQGATLTYYGDDPTNISWDFDDIVDNSDVNTNIDITPKNIKTGMYLYPDENGGLYVDNNTGGRLGIHYINNLADGVSADRNIASILWGWLGGGKYISYSNNQFQNLGFAEGTDVNSLVADENEVFYCAVVTDSTNTEPEEPEIQPTITARVISRQEMIDMAAQGYNFVWFVRSGSEYYAFSSTETTSGTAEAVPVNIVGTLEQGVTLTYYGDDPDSISWDFDSINLETSNVNGNIDITPRSIKTDEYIFPADSGEIFTTDITWGRIGIHYINNIAEGVNVDTNIGSFLWSWHSRYIAYSNGQFQVEQFAEDTGVGELEADDSTVFYCAVIGEPEEPEEPEPEPEEPVVPDNPINPNATLTARVLSRDEIYATAAKGYRYVIFARLGNEYYAFDSTGNPQRINVETNFEQGAMITYEGEDVDNICWEFDTVNGYVPESNIDVTIRSCKTGNYVIPNENNIFIDNTNDHPGFYKARNPQEGIDDTIANLWWSWYSGERCRHMEFVDGQFRAIVNDVYANQVANNDTNVFYVAQVYDPYYIAFNPGDGNGTASTRDKEGSMFDYGGTGGIDRVLVEVGSYIDTNGEVTVTFPDDSQLGTARTIISGDTLQYVIPKETSYDYKLVGWYNIATGEYIDVSNGPVTKTVKVVDNGNQINNVYYADWIAADYNLGKQHEGTQYNAVDTNEFIKTKVFDYNVLINMLSTSLTQNGVTQETWTDIGKFNNTDISSFIFQKNHTSGSLGKPNEMNDWNNSENDAAATGQWGMTSTNNAILNKIFDEFGNTLGVNYLGEGNYLYHIITDEDGNEYYQYDSEKNAASYNQEEQRFYVWDDTLDVIVSGELTPTFLPFNDVQLNNEDAYPNGEYNYWFGMSTEIEFYLSDTVGTVENKTNQVERSDSSGSTDMIFRFSGDDDVWIFIDDKPVLDLGGVHRAMNAEINFSTGEIIVTNSANEDLTSTRAQLANITELQEGKHTLNFYYLERGGGGSNYSLTFNMPHEPEEPDEPEEPEKIAVTVIKQWDNVEGITIPEKVSVTLYDGETAVETIELNQENEWTYVWQNLDATGKYTVKEEELEEYRVQYDTIYGAEAVAENNSWVETENLGPNDYIITNSNENNDGTSANEGFVALDDELAAKEITITNGVIDPSTITNDIIWTAIVKEDGYMLQNKETKQYLYIGNDNGLYRTDSIDEADIFYYETEISGIRLHIQRYSNQISVIYENNTFLGRINGNSGDHDHICIRLYESGQPITSNSRNYQITNTYKAPVVIKKLDSDSKTPLEGVKFTITNSEGKYYTPDGWVTEETTISTDSSGIAKILKLDDGTYTLNEIETKPGYNKVNNPITFTITNGKITLLNGNLVYLDEDDEKQLTMCIENVKGYILPDTGGHGVLVYQIIGITIMSMAVIVFKRNLNAKE